MLSLNSEFPEKSESMASNRPVAESRLQVENERVIVTQWRFAPDAETGWHKHGHDYVVVPEMDGKLLIESADGDNIVEMKAGQSYFREAGVEHNVVNASGASYAFVEVELK